jgi:demethylmenaquinone methyltransferase/2-methoxy-6-polyprenyl-1,4-benzoquinol methylase
MEPHPLMTAHYRSADEKQRFLRKVFDQSAPYYEKIIRWGFFGSGDRYRRQALLRGGLKKGMRVLDVGTGTGPTARAAVSIVENLRDVVGLDPSIGMLQESQRRLPMACVQGVADQLPLRDGQFDFLVMGFALRHVESLEGAFGEYLRALKPGGRALILDITVPRNRLARGITTLYFRDLLPWLTRRFTRSREAGDLMRYYWQTLDQMVEPEKVLKALKTAGFQEVQRHLVLGVFSEYQGTKP